MQSEIEWLQDYYLECCDEDWEHIYGINIANLDNPGWIVTIDLTDTLLEDVHFTEILIERSETDWCDCKVVENVFRGMGGAKNLKEIITVFREWVKLTDSQREP